MLLTFEKQKWLPFFKISQFLSSVYRQMLDSDEYESMFNLMCLYLLSLCHCYHYSRFFFYLDSYYRYHLIKYVVTLQKCVVDEIIL